MIAWMGWELKYAEQDIDMRSFNVEAIDALPIGSFIDVPVTLNHKERKQFEKQTLKDAPGLLSQAKEQNALFTQMMERKQKKVKQLHTVGQDHDDLKNQVARSEIIPVWHKLLAEQKKNLK